MGIKKEHLLTNGLEICENCEWKIEKQDSEFPICLLDGKEKGLVQSCEKFKRKTGEHITMQ